MKKLLILFCLTLLMLSEVSVLAQEVVYSSALREEAFELVELSNDSIVFVGYAEGSSNFRGGLVGMLDPDMNLLWSSTFLSTGGALLFSQFHSVCETADGNIAAAGIINSAGGQDDVVVVKFDKSGRLLWSSIWGGIDTEQCWKIRSGPDSCLYITGNTHSWVSLPTGVSELFVLKYDLRGNTLWQNVYGGAGVYSGGDICFLSGGDIGIGTYNSRAATNTNAGLLVLDSLGNVRRAFSYGTNEYDNFYALDTFDNGDFLMAGGSWKLYNGRRTNMIHISRIRRNGDHLWSRLLTSPNRDIRAFGVERAGDRGFLLPVHSFRSGTSYSAMAMVDTAGQVIWFNEYSRMRRGQMWSGAIGKGGEFYAAGYSESSSLLKDVHLIKNDTANYKSLYCGNQEQLTSLPESFAKASLSVSKRTRSALMNRTTLGFIPRSLTQQNICVLPTVEFDISGATLSEAINSYKVELNLVNAIGTAEVAFEIVEDGAISSSDYSIPLRSSTAVTSFTKVVEAGAQNSFAILINDDFLVEPTEGFTLKINGATKAVQIGPKSTFGLDILDNDFQSYDIAIISTVDTLGNPDSTGIYCGVIGTVVGLDLGGSDASFTLIDSTGGIGIFKSGGFASYNAKEGDLLEIRGTVGSTNGLTQIFADFVNHISSNNPIPAPIPVSLLDERTESEYIQITFANFQTNDPWPQGLNGDGKHDIEQSMAVNHCLYVSPYSEVFARPKPQWSFTVRGIGSQNDSTMPYLSNYSIVPHFERHIIEAKHKLIAPQDSTYVNVSGDGTTALKVEWSSSPEQEGGQVGYTFFLDSLNGDFQNPIASVPVGPPNPIQSQVDTFALLSYAGLSQIMSANGANLGDTMQLKWTVRANNNYYLGFSNVHLLNLIKGVITPSVDLDKVDITVFPNPGNGIFRLSLENASETQTFEANVFDARGRLVHSEKGMFNNETLNLQHLSSGTYNLQVNMPEFVLKERIVIIR